MGQLKRLDLLEEAVTAELEGFDEFRNEEGEQFANPLEKPIHKIQVEEW